MNQHQPPHLQQQQQVDQHQPPHLQQQQQVDQHQPPHLQQQQVDQQRRHRHRRQQLANQTNYFFCTISFLDYRKLQTIQYPTLRSHLNLSNTTSSKSDA